MTDGRYFQPNRRGEIFELKEQLHSANKEKKKDAVKKVIAAMTVGKDVSGLFPDVVNCMQTTNIELKKLVYLYVINYARTQPELAILAINTFRKDSLDPNPLIRALAVRTMGCIRLSQITEYLTEPLRRCCTDADPYVRKTAAICVAKMYDISPDMVEDQGFIDILQDLICDNNPMVVANAVASLTEISEQSGKTLVKNAINNPKILSQLLTALNECTEWSQVFILDALVQYQPQTAKDATTVLERVTARLSHANSAVVLSAVKVVMKLLNKIDDTEVVKAIQNKLSPPLVTLLSAEPEIQYVALRNINLIVQKRPSILAKDIKMFFCKYNDPVYVKMEKIEIIVRLAYEKNMDQVLTELKEYSTEVDIEFVRRAVRAIGRCAIKLEKASQKCINVLLELIETRVNYVVQEAIVVIKDIFRKYPNKYESIICTLCENLDTLDEPEAKASMIWIVGEYAERIDNADELLDSFIESFQDEPSLVRLQILTASVKLFLKSPASSQEMVTRVLKMCTEECDNPDVRDRAYIYWRLLSCNPEATKKVVLAPKPTISDDINLLEYSVLDKLIENIAMLASVYHRLPEEFVSSLRVSHHHGDEGSENGAEMDDRVQQIQKELQGQRYDSSEGEDAEAEAASEGSSAEESDMIDADSPNMEKTVNVPQLPPMKKTLVMSSEHAGTSGNKGLQIQASLSRVEGQLNLQLTLENKGQVHFSGWAIQFNKSYFGLAPTSSMPQETVAPGESKAVSVPVDFNPASTNSTVPSLPLVLQIAVKNNVDVFYFSVPYELFVLVKDSTPMNKNSMKQMWQQLGTENQGMYNATAAQKHSVDAICMRLLQFKWQNALKLSGENAHTLFFSGVLITKQTVLLELIMNKNGPQMKLAIRTSPPAILPLLQSLFGKILNLTYTQTTPTA